MNSDIRALAKWAVKNGYRVDDDSKGYTHFFDPNGAWIVCYPATPGNPRRRMADLVARLKASGLQVPPPSKSEQRSDRRRKRQSDDQQRY